MKARTLFTTLRTLGSRNMPSSGKHSFTRRAPLGALIVFVVLSLIAPFTAIQNSETIATFAADCATPKIIFNLGDTVCAVANDALLGSPVQRRFEWVAPNGVIYQLGPDIMTSPQTNSITLPTSGEFSQVGTWVVKTVDASNDGYAVARFIVRDPANDAVDLWTPIFAPFTVSAGSSAPFTVFVTNKGPNDAQNVQLTVSVATNSTFLSETQISGPAFSCTNPAVGAGGSSTCTIAVLPANTTAQIEFTFRVDSNAPDGTEVSSTATVTSDTNELFATDNTFTASATIPPGSAGNCDVSCPANIFTNKTPGQCGAVVTFTATGSGSNCGTIVCDPPSGAFFPTGTTNVICLGDTGGPCTFTITVQDPNPPTITCPANITVDESSPGFGFATVNYPSPVLNDSCAAGLSDCNPPTGSTFPVGTTAVTCQTSDNSGHTATCNFTITVTGVNESGCTLTCSDDVTQTAAAGQCSAAVTYTAPTTSGTCGTVTCTPASGSTFPVGATIVNCSNGQGANCDFTVTVVPPSAPTITTCASNKTISANANCEAVVPNLLNEVVATGCSVTLSQSPAAGSIITTGVVTVIITAENVAGETTCMATVTVTESTPPVITACPTASGAPANAACQAAVPDVTGSVVATDNCTPSALLIITQSPAAGTLVGKGTTTITVTVKDQSNNSATCTTTFTVNDTTPPTIITCAANRTLSTNGASQIALPNLLGEITASDNCTAAASLIITQSPAAGTMVGIGNTTVTFTVTDASGNQSTCTATVTVVKFLLKEFVAFSSEFTRLYSNAKVNTGNIGANTSLPDPNGPPDDKVEVDFGENARMLQVGSSIVGDTLQLRANSRAYNIHYNESIIGSNVTISGNQVTPQALPVITMPTLPTITPGTTDVTVAVNQTQTLAAGSYRNITVGANATLILSGGLYQVASINVQSNAKLYMQAATEVRVANQVITASNATVGPHPSVPSLQASQIIIYVAGVDTGSADNPSPAAAQLGENTTVFANIYAPNGTVWLKANAKGTGAFVGLRVRAGENVELTLKSAF